jgi:hypothetical protein
VIVTIAHLRSVPGLSKRTGFCARGARAWFERHELDWGDFVRNGIDAQRLLDTGDGLALILVEHARTVEAQGHG